MVCFCLFWSENTKIFTFLDLRLQYWDIKHPHEKYGWTQHFWFFHSGACHQWSFSVGKLNSTRCQIPKISISAEGLIFGSHAQVSLPQKWELEVVFVQVSYCHQVGMLLGCLHSPDCYFKVEAWPLWPCKHRSFYFTNRNKPCKEKVSMFIIILLKYSTVRWPKFFRHFIAFLC